MTHIQLHADIVGKELRPLPALIFGSRWLQLPLYLGLIVAQGVYVILFLKELWHLIRHATELTEQAMMLMVLGLIDVVMISNLLMMVIVGGYETFVSRLRLQGHPDQPEWLSHVNASVLKIKLAMAIIGISSIHLLRTFIEAGSLGSGQDHLHRDRRDVADHHPHRLHLLRHRHRGRGSDGTEPRRPRQARGSLKFLSFFADGRGAAPPRLRLTENKQRTMFSFRSSDRPVGLAEAREASRGVVMFRAVVEEAAALASLSLFLGMIAIWAQVLGGL